MRLKKAAGRIERLREIEKERKRKEKRANKRFGVLKIRGSSDAWSGQSVRGAGDGGRRREYGKVRVYTQQPESIQI